MSRHTQNALRAHLVGSIPLPDSETVFRTLAGSIGAYLDRMPDGETGLRQMWIKFLQNRLADHPAIEVAAGEPPFRFKQWDGKLIREISRKRLKPGMEIDPDAFASGYADMAMESWRSFALLQDAGVIAPGVRFQIAMPTPIAPAYNNMIPADRPRLLPALTHHFINEVDRIAAALPHERVAIQWDVCQEVLAWEGVYDPGPVDFRSETLGVLEAIGDAVPATIELGFHLCYGSPGNEHIVQPRDTAVLVDMANAITAAVERPIAYFHLPVPKPRVDDAYFAPLANLALDADTALYLGLIHFDDRAGDAQRLAAAQKHAHVDGIATECGMGRGDPARLMPLLESHIAAIEADQAAASR